MLRAFFPADLKAQSPELSKPSVAEADFIRAAMAKHMVPGASIAVIDGHRLLWAAGFGVRRQGSEKKVDENTVFQAASCSKPAAAMAVMVLAERKVVKLDEHINGALHAWKVPDSKVRDGEAVALRRLLSHSAGISVHGFRGYAEGERIPSLLNVLKGRPPANSGPVIVEKKPGEGFQYSGGGYCIVQQLLMELGKRPFEEIMDTLVLKPCGMAHSSYGQPLRGPLSENQAAGHYAAGHCVTGDHHIYPEQAAAGLWTTAADYAQFFLAIDQAATNSASSVFSKATIQEMTVVQKEPYGLGWSLGRYQGSATISHGGANEGFRCFVWSCPALGKGVVVFTNSDNGSDFTDEIFETLRSGKLR